MADEFQLFCSLRIDVTTGIIDVNVRVALLSNSTDFIILYISIPPTVFITSSSHSGPDFSRLSSITSLKLPDCTNITHLNDKLFGRLKHQLNCFIIKSVIIQR